MGENMQNLLRKLPGVDQLLQNPKIGELSEGFPRTLTLKALRQVVGNLREGILTGQVARCDENLSMEYIAVKVKEELEEMTKLCLRPVINATGVVLHTNLGRAILAKRAQENLLKVNRSYANLELNLDTGKRGSRYSHVEELLVELTGAEDALVVNNNAAAVLLVLNTLAQGKEVPVSRGQLVEIGGSFRIPEVMNWSGCRLVEVGTTNKTHLADYKNAVNSETALLLKVHTSNYRILGFTDEVETSDLVRLGHEFGLPVVEDLGSGMLVDLTPYGLPQEPTVQEVVAAGIDVVTFSGDKLLGGPQAGIIVGRQEYIQRMKGNPLTRALRIDKLTLAALEATLHIYRDPVKVLEEIPILRMLTLTEGELKKRANHLASLVTAGLHGRLKATVVAEESQVGGGAMPLAKLPTWVVAVESEKWSAQELADGLREGEPPILVRLVQGQVILDVRTLGPGEAEMVKDALLRVLN